MSESIETRIANITAGLPEEERQRTGDELRAVASLPPANLDQVAAEEFQKGSYVPSDSLGVSSHPLIPVVSEVCITADY